MRVKRGYAWAMGTTETTPLRAAALVCTLSPSPAASSSQLLAEQTKAALGKHAVTGKLIRITDHDIRPGMKTDMGEGVMERLNAEVSETDDEGRITHLREGRRGMRRWQRRRCS